jgi:hypothetical protein
MLVGLRISLLLCLLACAVRGADADPLDIVRRSIAAENENTRRARNYTFLQREEERDLDGAGHVKSTRSKTYDITMLEHSPYRRLIERDDRPLPAKEEEQEQAKLRKSIEERRRETEAQRARRLADYDKRRGRDRGMLNEIPEAFDFRLRGEESIESRPVYVIEATPRAGYRARNTQARLLLPKLKATLWIDRADLSWVRLEAEIIDNISLGLFLFRLSKGARLELQQTRVNDEVWLPRVLRVKASARLVAKKVNREQDFTFRNFRKFQTDSRVVSTGPTVE